MSDPTTVQDARSFLGKRQKLVDEVASVDIDFVHGEILARGARSEFRVRHYFA